MVKHVSKQLGFSCNTDDLYLMPQYNSHENKELYLHQMYIMAHGQLTDFDVCWIDNIMPAEVLARLKPYQRVSQYPGITIISNKNKLA